MKKRRLTIIAFLLCATLLMGIGYAAVSTTLNISGRAIFSPQNVVESEVASAIKFKADSAAALNDYCTSATISGDDTATIAVVINSEDDVIPTEGYTAKATYTVEYTATNANAHYSDVELGYQWTVLNVSGQTVEGWTVKVTPTYPDGKTTLGVGETMDLLVEVTYAVPANGEAPTANVEGTVNIVLTYTTVEA